MTVEIIWKGIWFGVFGGISIEILHWYFISRKPEGSAPYAKKPVYWLSTILMIGLSGLMPALYLDGTESALLCFHLGASTPILLQKMVAAAPDLTTQQGVSVSIKTFFTW
ncbi:MAG: hypothetical protein GY795_44810 [Desulfobacterales bacterium]|nr:hypothetical protein [Desulfobacterales bacterium]